MSTVNERIEVDALRARVAYLRLVLHAQSLRLDQHERVLNAARIASYCISGGGTNSHVLFPELREAIQTLDDLKEKQKKDAPTDQF